MFEKKTKFGCLNGPLEDMATVASRHYYNSGIAALSQHILDCHAEIDRLNGELTALRAQPAGERVWISSETHKNVPVAGWYLSTYELDEEECVGILQKETYHELVKGTRYSLLFAAGELPKPPAPPQPIEVKVGKYQERDGTVLKVLAIVEGFVMCLIDGESFTNTVKDFQESLFDNARRLHRRRR